MKTKTEKMLIDFGNTSDRMSSFRDDYGVVTDVEVHSVTNVYHVTFKMNNACITMNIDMFDMHVWLWSKMQ